MLGPRVPREVLRRGELRRAGRATVAGAGGFVPVRCHDVPVDDSIVKFIQFGI